MSEPALKKRLNEILGRNAGTFATSLVQLIKNNNALAECEPLSVVGAAMTAATLQLPLNNSLGFAYIVPYNKGQGVNKTKVAQFQIGYKGFIQLGLRTNQYETMNVTDVKQGELLGTDFMTGESEFAWLPRGEKRDKAPTIGYVAYIRMINGFNKQLYMSVQEIQAHGKKYSKSFNSPQGLWKKDFGSMASKTTLKLLIGKYGALSVDQKLQLAIQADQAVITDPEKITDGNYTDNPTNVEKIDPDKERALMLVKDADTQEELDLVRDSPYGEELLPMIKAKQKELNLKNK